MYNRFSEEVYDSLHLLPDKELCELYEETLRTLVLKHNFWTRLNKASKFARRIAWAIVLLCAVIGGILALAQEKAWYLLALDIAVWAALSVFGCGLLLLILKPLFYHQRKSAVGVHNKIVQLEGAIQNIQYLLVMRQLYPGAEPEDLPERNVEKKNNRFCSFLRNIHEASGNIRILDMEKDRYGEWAWVLSAAFLVFAAIALLISYIIFAVLVAIFILWFAVDSVYKPTDYDYRETYYSPEYQEQESLASFLFAPVFKKREQVIAALAGEKERIKKQFKKLEMFCLENPQYCSKTALPVLPYWERYMQLGKQAAEKDWQKWHVNKG